MKIGRVKNKMRFLKNWAESIEQEIQEYPLEGAYTYFKIPVSEVLVQGRKAKRSCQVEAIRSVFSTLDTVCSKNYLFNRNVSLQVSFTQIRYFKTNYCCFETRMNLKCLLLDS